MLAIFAVVGVLVIGFGIAVGTGLVSLAGLDPFKNNGPSTQPTTRPAEADASNDQPTDSEASLAALKHPGYQDRVIYLTAADAKVEGPKVRFERTAGYAFSGRGPVVDQKNRLPNGLIRYWTGPSDSATWTFNCPQAGKYVVTFDCIASNAYGTSRSRGVAGGKFNITSGEATLTRLVEADVRGRHGYSSAYHLVDVGEIYLSAGQIDLKIQPAEADSGLLGVRSVRLYPAE
jgi:hypothetical protein